VKNYHLLKSVVRQQDILVQDTLACSLLLRYNTLELRSSLSLYRGQDLCLHLKYIIIIETHNSYMFNPYIT